MSEKVAGKESVNDNRAVVGVVFTEAFGLVERVFRSRSPSNCRTVGSGKDDGENSVSKEKASTLISRSRSSSEKSLQDHIMQLFSCF